MAIKWMCQKDTLGGRYNSILCLVKKKKKIREDMTSRKVVKFSYHLQIIQNGKSCGFVVKSLKVYYINSV